MSVLWAVYRRELGAFFRSGIVYSIAFGVIVFLGIVFAAGVTDFVAQNQAGIAQISAEAAVTNLMGTLTFLMFIIAPLLTMRLISEETREGTLEVLLTLPVPEWVFVVGKYLAACTVYSFILLLTLVHTVMLLSFGPVDAGLIVSAYGGAWLYGGAVLAISILFSAMTEDQIVAAFASAAVILMLYFTDGIAAVLARQGQSDAVSSFVRELGLLPHYQNTMMNGIVRAEDIVYFIAVIVLMLFVTTLAVGIRRWRAS